MGLLDGVLSNPTVQRLAFGQLKGLFSEKNLDFILVKLDGQGEIELELYKKGEAIVMPIGRTITEGETKPEGAPLEPEKINISKTEKSPKNARSNKAKRR